MVNNLLRLVMYILFHVCVFLIPVYAEPRLSLQACIDTALKNQPAIRAAQEGTHAGKGRVIQAASPYFPQIKASTGYSESHSAGGAFGESINKSYTTTLSVSQLIYDFGKTGNSLDAAEAGFRAAQWELDKAVQDAILNVKQSYYALLKAEKLVTVAKKTLEQAESHLKQAEAFYRAGSKPRFDVTRAEVEVNSGRLEKVNADNGLKLARISLNNAMGAAPSADIEIEDVLAAPASVPALEPAQTEAVKNRPEMQRADTDIEAARARLKAEQSNYLPSIIASGSYNWSDGTSEAGPFSGDVGNSWNAGVTFTLPLFEGGITRGRVSEAMANLLILEAQRDTLRQTVLLEVNQVYADLESAAVRMSVMESSLKKARENLDIAQGRYEAGIGAYIEVTDAQLASVKAETDHLQAQYDYQLAVARLYKAMGRKG